VGKANVAAIQRIGGKWKEGIFAIGVFFDLNQDT
jgi:hypothetical protein